uniref:AcidPPc domain-containing protein n=1 Tax=Caenorhabditis japonica TaxID=281687 RepID=A0A8R1IE91_CAEJA
MERRKSTYYSRFISETTMNSVIHWGEEADIKYSRILYEKNEYQTACTWIEWLIHGFPWFVFATLALIVAYGKDFSDSTQTFFDLIVIAIIKFHFHRERPIKSYSNLQQLTVDVYSFPSGHSSRAAMLVVMLYNFAPLFAVPLIPLPLIVGLSRVALGRHYITDVVAGTALGILEGRLMLAIPFGINSVFRGLLK